jgi:hypothetical protein
VSRLILVSQKICPQFWKLATTLSAQHDVLVLTSRDETFHDPDMDQFKNLKVMRVFKSWSWSEAVSLLPITFSQDPQIWHFWEPNDKNHKIKSAYFAMAFLAKAQLKDKIVISLQAMKSTPSWSETLQYFMKISDAILAPDYEELLKTRGILLRANRKAVIPPLLSYGFEHLENNPMEESLIPQKQDERILVIPQSIEVFHQWKQSERFMQNLLSSPRNKIVFVSPDQTLNSRERKMWENTLMRLGIQDRVFMAPQTLERFFQVNHRNQPNQTAIILAGQRHADIELYQFLAISLEFKVPLLLDIQQVDRSSFVWQKNKNCWVVSKYELMENIAEWAKRPSFELPIFNQQNTESVFEKLRDRSLNELNRLYSQLLYSDTALNVR